MNVFKVYCLINISMVLGHAVLYVVAIMGLGSGNSDAPRSEIIPILMFLAVLGASPNMLLLLASWARKSQVKENAFWGAVFTLIVLLGYFIAFWPLAMEFPA